MSGTRMRRSFCLVLAISMASGCHKSAGESDKSGAAFSGKDAEARDTAMAEVAKHAVKGSDGWITAKMTGTSFASVHYLRQYRELTVEGVNANELSDADRMNGFEWAGEVSFKKTPCREAGEQGVVLDGMANVTVMRPPRGAWSQWIDYQPEPLRVQKVKGQWQVQPDNPLLTGKIPGPQDYASAGVK